MKSKKVKGTKQQFENVIEEFKLHVSRIKYRNAKQKQYVESLTKYPVNVTVGPAGSSKTYLTLYAALKALEKGEVEQIVLVKSVVPIEGENLGYRPGNEQDKIMCYCDNFFGNLDQLVGEEVRKELFKRNLITIKPIETIRGCGFKNKFIIVDECQEIRLKTFQTIITRLGENSKMCFLGDPDPSQIDIRDTHNSSLEKIKKLFDEDEIVGTFEFTEDDIQRSPYIKHILEKLKTLSNNRCQQK